MSLIDVVFAAGGYGTLEEVLEIITWAQLGIHTKPVSGILNLCKSCASSDLLF